MMRKAAAFACASVLMMSTAYAAPEGQAAPAQKKVADPNEIICEKQKELGSRLATKRVCMTRAQWAERRLIDRQEIEKAQTNRGYRAGN